MKLLLTLALFTLFSQAKAEDSLKSQITDLQHSLASMDKSSPHSQIFFRLALENIFAHKKWPFETDPSLQKEMLNLISSVVKSLPGLDPLLLKTTLRLAHHSSFGQTHKHLLSWTMIIQERLIWPEDNPTLSKIYARLVQYEDARTSILNQIKENIQGEKASFYVSLLFSPHHSVFFTDPKLQNPFISLADRALNQRDSGPFHRAHFLLGKVKETWFLNPSKPLTELKNVIHQMPPGPAKETLSRFILAANIFPQDGLVGYSHTQTKNAFLSLIDEIIQNFPERDADMLKILFPSPSS